MDALSRAETEVGSPRLMEFFIRAVLIVGLAWLCFRAFSPFLTLAIWSIILAVTLYPVHQRLARRVGNKQWLASLLIVVVGLFVVVTPMALLMNAFADEVRGFIASVQDNTLRVPPPNESVRSLPAVGEKIHDAWSKAHTDLPSVVAALQPKIGELARVALGMVASVGTTLLLFFASFIIASILMAYGESGERTMAKIFNRVAGRGRGDELEHLSISSIRTVALGVLGVAAIQAILVGVVLLIAGVPGAGILAIITLVLGIAQIPALIVILPVIAYVWASGNYDTTWAIIYTIVFLLSGLADNVLKPIFLGRGVNVPMPVILFGALGGMASAGILGMFVGATALALGYEIFMAWVKAEPEPTSEEQVAAPLTEPMLDKAAIADS